MSSAVSQCLIFKFIFTDVYGLQLSQWYTVVLGLYDIPDAKMFWTLYLFFFTPVF